MVVRKLASLIFCFTALGACDVAFGPGVYDFHTPLSGDYYLFRTSSHQIFIAPLEWQDDTPIIPEKVIELDHNQTWVIAKQQHLRDRSPDDPNDSYQEPDPGNFSYWILRTRSPEVWGPLSETEFSEMKLSLDVTSSLKLRDVYEYACGVNEYYECDLPNKN